MGKERGNEFSLNINELSFFWDSLKKLWHRGRVSFEKLKHLTALWRHSSRAVSPPIQSVRLVVFRTTTTTAPF